jgi:hypothetical protein
VPHGSVSETIPASSAEVFRLLHDYDRRLAWDTLLQEATLCEPRTKAQLHATSICRGRWYLGGIALHTQYISFNPPNVAAVKMLNRPLVFESFAATIRHRDLGNGTSSVEYKFNFIARPFYLRWLLHPVMAAVFRWETRKRLRALRRYFAEGSSNTPHEVPKAAEQSTTLEPAARTEGQREPPPSTQ